MYSDSLVTEQPLAEAVFIYVQPRFFSLKPPYPPKEEKQQSFILVTLKCLLKAKDRFLFFVSIILKFHLNNRNMYFLAFCTVKLEIPLKS